MSSSWYARATMERDELVLAGSHMGIRLGGVEVLKPRQTPSPNLMNASPTTPSSLAVAFAVAKGVRFAENSARSLNTMLTTFNAYGLAHANHLSSLMALKSILDIVLYKAGGVASPSLSPSLADHSLTTRCRHRCRQMSWARRVFNEGAELLPNAWLAHANHSHQIWSACANSLKCQCCKAGGSGLAIPLANPVAELAKTSPCCLAFVFAVHSVLAFVSFSARALNPPIVRYDRLDDIIYTNDFQPSWEEIPDLIPTYGQKSGIQSLQNPIWVPLKLVPHVSFNLFENLGRYTSFEAFDSMSKALSLSTSSILEGSTNLKLEEAVPRSKRGEEDEAKKTPSPEKIINLKKTPPTEGEKEKTPPADPKGKSISAGQGTEKKDTPKKTVDPTKPDPSSPKADESESSSFSREDEYEEERVRKEHLPETERHGREAALLLQKQIEEDEARMEERRLREQEEAARLAAQRPLVTQIQRVPPTGNDIVPFMTYLLPGDDEVLDCPVSKNAAILPMMDPIKGETNVDVLMASEFKRSRDFINRHASTRAALFSRSRIISLHKITTRQFQNSRFFEYGIERANGSSRIINSADFHRMNSADLITLAYICHHRAETKLEIKFHYLALRDIINAIIYDFGFEDAELYSDFKDAPPPQEPNTSLEGLGDTSKGYTTAPIRAMLFEGEAEKGSSPIMLCFRLEEKHLYQTDLLRSFTQSIEDDEHMDADVKVSFTNELKWFLAVRKHWRSLLRFIDNK
ncbi:hypothetical protein LXL04_007671 [Taraxacum kok-saghyz]